MPSIGPALVQPRSVLAASPHAEIAWPVEEVVGRLDICSDGTGLPARAVTIAGKSHSFRDRHGRSVAERAPSHV